MDITKADETQQDPAAEAADAEAKLKADYPAVTQFKGRTIRYAPLTEGQLVALGELDRDDDDRLLWESYNIVLATLEGCIGPDQWKRVRMDLARKRIDAADVMQLFVKIMDKMRRDADKVKADKAKVTQA